ncbi:hypothetical protein AAG906_040122 [Vitis piasezkii]
MVVDRKHWGLIQQQPLPQLQVKKGSLNYLMVIKRRRIAITWSTTIHMVSTIFILYPILLCCYQTCAARDTIRQNDPISDGDGETLLSAGKTFELGFFTPNGSSNGNLVLNSNGRGRPFWSTPLQKSSSTEKVAQLIDSGNLVLKNDQLQTSLWQSFGNATDTFLPGMKMDGNLVLTSWKSSSDPGSGNFTFRKDQEVGDEIFRPDRVSTVPCLPGFQPNFPAKWNGGDFSGGCRRISPLCSKNDTFLRLEMMRVKKSDTQFNTTNEKECENYCNRDCNNCQAYAYVEAETRADTAICMIWEENLNDIQEAYLDGGHDLYVRVAVSDIEPMGRNCKICGTNIIPYPLSTGTDCGDPKYLSFYCENSTGQVIFMRPNNTYYQVTSIRPEAKEFSIQLGEDNCIASSDAMKKLLSSTRTHHFGEKWVHGEKSTSSLYPFSDAEWLREIQIEWRPPLEPICNSTEDCKYWPHSNCNTTRDGQKRCHCKINYQWDPTNVSCFPVEAGPSQRKQQPYVIFIGSVVAVIVISCFTVFIYYLRRRRVSEMQGNYIQGNPVLHLYHSERRVKDLIGWGQFTEDDREGIDVPFFDLGSILAATNNLSDANKLGQGGFGPVYKGSFPGGQDIAVKRLSSVSGQGLEEFKNEVVLIAKLQHRNLVRLLGYCVEEDEKILLYEYMPNKSLDSFIFDRTLRFLLNWEKRFDIILGIARGLLYLHQDSRLRIIHRDLKTSNILLDEEMNPKISDFGLARIFGGKQTEASTNRVVGTYGYMSPEYALDGFFSIKSDVFSFGVVVLEIISGKRNTGFYQSQQALSLLGYAWRLWQDNKALDLMDQSLHETCDVAEFLRCVNVGLLCVQEDPSDRPVMSNVVFLLGSETATLPTPKQPAFTVRRGVFSTASSSSKPETCTNELTVSVDDTITPEDWLSNDGGTLVSAGKTFELGFFNPDGSSKIGRFVGIWDYRSKPRRVVWLKVLAEINGAVHWSTDIETSSSKDRMVKLMDSGNLVLSDNRSGEILWESFRNPTDTFLPGMKMDESLILTSWLSPVDPAPGNYTFKLDQEKENQYIISQNLYVHWRSEDWDGTFDGMPEAIRSFLSNISRNGTYTRHSSIPNSSVEKQLVMIWWAPQDRCSVSNACGKFGSCSTKNALMCKCLPGFKPVSPDSWKTGEFSSGCTRKSPKCKKNSSEDMFLSLKIMKAKKPYSSILADTNDGQYCRKACLSDCQCQAYAQTKITQRGSNPECLIWTDELSGLQEEYASDADNLFVRVSISDIESTVRNCQTCGSNMIPYPLSTGSKCGDPMYFNFECNITTGQVQFKVPGGTYRVTSINPETLTFVIQLKESDCSSRSLIDKIPPLNPPFHMTNVCTVPVCTSSADCKDWPNSNCRTQNGTTKCFCNEKFKWNGSSLDCTQDLGNKMSSSSSPVVVVGITIVVVLVALLSTIGYIAYLRKRNITKRKGNRANPVLHLYDSESRVKHLIDLKQFKDEDKKGIDVPFFDLKDILAATDNFSDSHKLGQGGFGPVYKGKFPDGKEVAVKRLSSASRQGLVEFKNEVVLIAKLQHRNLVRLLGYCIEGEEKILLYEYMPNKSLDSFIFDRMLCVLLNWESRFDIILGIARGLIYLHQDSRLKIIHRDLKTSNILLDGDMNPKISDFGLARIFESKQTEANTNRVVGTFGYMSPEYALDGFFSVKSDVFSFGVVVLEIISGKRNTGFYQSDQAMSLLGYAWRLWKEDKVYDLMDQTLSETCNINEFLRCVNVGLLCVQEDPSDRPTMPNAFLMLSSEIATLPVPQQPAFVVRRGPPSLAPSSSTNPKTSSNNEITDSLEEELDFLGHNHSPQGEVDPKLSYSLEAGDEIFRRDTQHLQFRNETASWYSLFHKPKDRCSGNNPRGVLPAEIKNFSHEQTSGVQPRLTIFGDKRLHGKEGQSTSSLYPFSDAGCGVMSPEYALYGFFSVKSNVFSFGGTVVLEIMCGKRNTGFYQHGDCGKKNKALDLMDQSLHETCDVSCLAVKLQLFQFLNNQLLL